MDAADFLLEREYGDCSFFDSNEHASVFTPPTFVSNQYMKQSTVAVLDYDVKKDIERLLVNLKNHSPTYWLTRELEAFIRIQNGYCTDKKVFDQWILNVKIMYLMIEELKDDQVHLPPTTTDLNVFVQACLFSFLDVY